MEVLEDSPCNGVCRMTQIGTEYRCESCFRDYTDIEQWYYMTKEARQERMKQLKKERVMTLSGVTHGNKNQKKTSRRS